MSRSTIGIASSSAKVSEYGPVDHPVDGERPAVGVDPGHGEVGVDPVERGVAGAQRADAPHRALEALREGPRGHRRRGQGGRRRAAGRGQPLPEGRRHRPRPGSPRRRRAGTCAGRRGRWGTPWPAARRRASPVTGRRPRRAGQQAEQHRDTGDRRGHAGQRVDRASRPGAVSAARVARPVSSRMNATPSQVRRRARTPATADASRVTTVTLPEQDRLVPGAELRDGPLLDRGRGGVDDGGPDGEHGEAAGSRKPATRCPTAMPATAARTPVSA